jgi:hypothetical protein
VDHLIEIASRYRKEFFLWEGESPPPLRAAVIVDADRGKTSARLLDRRARAEARGRRAARARP